MTCKSNESNNKKEWKEEYLKIPKRKQLAYKRKKRLGHKQKYKI